MSQSLIKFPQSCCLYFVKTLELFGGDVYDFGNAFNLQMFPVVESGGHGIVIKLMGIHRNNSSLVKVKFPAYDRAPYLSRIEYFIYGLSGQASVRDGFQHDFKQGDCFLDPGTPALFCGHRRGILFELYPVEDIVDHVNAGTGFQVMQFCE